MSYYYQVEDLGVIWTCWMVIQVITYYYGNNVFVLVI